MRGVRAPPTPRPLTKVRFVPLVEEGGRARKAGGVATPAAGAAGSVATAAAVVDYDARYRKGWAYGKDPNGFVPCHSTQSPLSPHSHSDRDSLALFRCANALARLIEAAWSATEEPRTNVRVEVA